MNLKAQDAKEEADVKLWSTSSVYFMSVPFLSFHKYLSTECDLPLLFGFKYH